MKSRNPQQPVSKLTDWIFGCLIISLTGVALNLFQVGFNLEEGVGLNWLFQVRGARPQPENVVVVSTDRQSAYELGLPQEVYKWPRSLHGKLVSRLTELGAKAIVFDLFFKDSGSQEENTNFAEGIRNAGNVILFEKLTLADSLANPIQASIRIPPTEQLGVAAAGLAPNPYPTGTLLVDQFWLFDPSNPLRATLPLLAFQLYSLPLFEELREMLEEVVPTEMASLPQRQNDIHGPDGIQKLVGTLRTMFKRHPTLRKALIGKLQLRQSEQPIEKSRLLSSLIGAYSGEESRFIDFYGPPRTVLTIPYFCVLMHCSPQRLGGIPTIDFSDKVVFVGLSETVQSEQQDRFPTVFTSDEGLEISGVEIAATALGNLLEGRHVTPLPIYLHYLVLLLWGVVLGTVFFGLSNTRLKHRSGLLMAALVGFAVLIGGVYFALVVWAFRAQALWLPFVIPLVVQLPVGLFAALFGTYREVNRLRFLTEKALANYVPAPVVKPLARRIAEITGEGKEVHGLCLFTDVQGYTKVSEALAENPDRLHALMKRYFEVVCTPVRERGGMVSDITGDSVLAIWPAGDLTSDLRKTVCMAALDILAEVDRFNSSEPEYPLPTRVGISGGSMFVGEIGAEEYLTHQPLGDVVNTASRIETLNKQLGTHLLASHLVVDGLSGFLTRKVGKFQLIGKTRAVVVDELLGPESEVDAKFREAIQLFGAGLEHFYARRWDQAEESFLKCVQLRGKDGPSQFYLGICRHYRTHPPAPDWDGTIALTAK